MLKGRRGKGGGVTAPLRMTDEKGSNLEGSSDREALACPKRKKGGRPPPRLRQDMHRKLFAPISIKEKKSGRKKPSAPIKSGQEKGGNRFKS